MDGSVRVAYERSYPYIRNGATHEMAKVFGGVPRKYAYWLVSLNLQDRLFARDNCRF